MTAVLAALRVALLHEGNEIRNALLDGIRQGATRYSDPQLQSTLDFMRSPAGLAFMLVFMLIFGMVVLVVLGALGGAFGGAVLGRREPS